MNYQKNDTNFDDFEMIGGKSIVSSVIDYFTPNVSGYGNKSTKMLEQYGNNKIVKLTIYRTPLHNVITKALNVISLGKFGELQKKYGFDKFFHLALVATLENNKNVIIEKLDIVSLSDSYKTNSDTEVLEVSNYKGGLSLNRLMSKARENVGDYKFFSYDPFTNNCQYFIKYLLEGAGLYGEKEKNFLFQNIEELAKQMPRYATRFSRLLTDTAATFSKIIGKGDEEFL
jgi:hypothetical protein